MPVKSPVLEVAEALADMPLGGAGRTLKIPGKYSVGQSRGGPRKGSVEYASTVCHLAGCQYSTR